MELGKLFLCLVLLIKTTSLLSQTKKPFIKFEENGKYGLVDTSGNVIIEGFDDLEKKSNGFISASKNGLVYVLNDDFKVIFRGNYKSVSAGAEKNQFVVQKGDKYGVVDARKKFVIPFKYSYVKKISEGYYKVRLGKLYGILNSKGKVVIPIIYKAIVAENIAENIPILVENEQGKKLIDISNKVLIASFDYDNMERATLEYMIVKNTKGYFLLNNTGKVIVGPSESISFWPINQDLNKGFIVAKNYGFALLFNSVTLISYGLFGDINGFYEDFPAVVIGGQYGFVDLDGKIFIPPAYDFSLGFNEGLAPVLKDGKWGAINERNELVIPYQFVGSIGSFNNGVAEYRKGSISKPYFSWRKDGLINTKGEIIAEPIYERIEYIGGNKAIVEFDGINYLYDFVKKKKIKKLEKKEYAFMEAY